MEPPWFRLLELASHSVLFMEAFTSACNVTSSSGHEGHTTPREVNPFLAQRRCQNPREQSTAVEGEHPSENPRAIAGSPPGCRGRLPSTAPCP